MFVSLVEGKTYSLFDSAGRMNSEYDKIVQNLEQNDILKFSNGKSFQLKKVLGSGNTTLILETIDGFALRIPLSAGPSKYSKLPCYMYINGFIEGYESIKNYVRTVKIYDNNPNQYVLVEKVDLNFTLQDLLDGKIHLNSQEKAYVTQQLLNWTKETMRFMYIGDFRFEQLGFNGNEWILLDFNGKAAPFDDWARYGHYNLTSHVLTDSYGKSILPNDSPFYSQQELRLLFDTVTSFIKNTRIEMSGKLKCSNIFAL